MWCSQVTSDECDSEVHVLGLFIIRDRLAATFTASAFALIGPAAGYVGTHAQTESVYQNCVLGRCSCLSSIIVLHLPLFEIWL